MVDVVSDVIINYKSVGLDKVGAEIKQTSVSLDGLVVSATSAEKSTASLENRFKSLERQFSTTEGNAQKFAKVQDSVNKAVAQNPELQGRANEVLAAAAQRYGMVEKATAGLADAHKGLDGQAQAAMHSMRSMFDSIVSGTPVTQALTQQFGHLSYAASGEGGIAGAFKGAGSAISGMIETAKGFLTPANMAIGAIVGMGAAIITAAEKFATAQKEIERSLIGIGGQSGATLSKINQFAQIGPQQSITGASPSERRETATTFAQAGVDVSKLPTITKDVQAYAIVAGTDATKATEALAAALGGDLVKAVDDLQKVYGALDPKLRDTVQSMLLVNNTAGAQQAILDALAGANKRALDTVTPLSAAWSGLKNAGEMVAEGWLNILSYKVFETVGQKAEAAAKQVAAAAAAAQQQANQIQNKGQAVVDTYEPEIQQVNKLNLALADLVRAKEAAAAAGGTFNDGGAEQKIRNTIKATEDAQAASIAWQQTIAEVSLQYQGVSESAALALHAQEAQLPVIEAIGGAAKMAAQYTKDYYDTLDRTKNPAEALLAASENLRVKQAEINAGAKEMLWNLQNQAAAAAAVTDEEKRTAEAIALANKLKHDGVDATLAQQVADQQASNSKAAADAAAKKASADAAASTAKAADSTKSAANNMSDVARYSVIVMDDMGHIGVWGESLAHSLAAAAPEMQKIADDADRAAYASSRAGQAAAARLTQRAYQTDFDPQVMPKDTLTFGGGYVSSSYAQGGTGKVLDVGMDRISLAQQMGLLSGTPADIYKNPNVDKLTDSLDGLKDSTDKLTKSNEDLLSPYYTQDPRTSHIGFRSQGMASGGYVDVPGGASANDNMMAMIPVASGERIYVDPQSGRRGTASGGMVINISSPITINGNANADQFGRTVFQANQQLAKQVRAATQ